MAGGGDGVPSFTLTPQPSRAPTDGAAPPVASHAATIVTMDRVWIRGTSGSGKTTLGLAVAERLGAPAIDLDELNWLPGWRERPKEEFEALAAEALAATRWVVSGNYSRVSGPHEAKADTIVWLDYPKGVVFWRVLSRTVRRCLLGTPCCNGNREDFRRSFLERDSVVWWSLTTHARRRRDCEAFMALPPTPGQTRLRHRSPRETAAWLASLGS